MRIDSDSPNFCPGLSLHHILWPGDSSHWPAWVSSASLELRQGKPLQTAWTQTWRQVGSLEENCQTATQRALVVMTAQQSWMHLTQNCTIRNDYNVIFCHIYFNPHTNQSRLRRQRGSVFFQRSAAWYEPCWETLGPLWHQRGTKPGWEQSPTVQRVRFLVMMVTPRPGCAWSPDPPHQLPLMLSSNQFESLSLAVTRVQTKNTTQQNKQNSSHPTRGRR